MEEFIYINEQLYYKTDKINAGYLFLTNTKLIITTESVVVYELNPFKLISVEQVDDFYEYDFTSEKILIRDINLLNVINDMK